MKNLHICLWMAGNSNWMGGAIYTQNLARAIASLPEAETANIRLSVVCSAADLNLVNPIRSCVDKVYVYGTQYLKVCQLLAEKLVFLPTQLFNPLKIDFIYPMLTNVVGKRTPYAWGAWIPDFQHHYFPDYFTEEENNYRDASHQKFAELAPTIILSSQMAQSDFNRLYPQAASRSRVMNFISYLEPEYFTLKPQEIQTKYELPDSFFLISNQFWQHKNHALVIEALGILKKQKIYPTVVCTGNIKSLNNSTEYFNKLMSRIEELELGKQVRILGLIPRVEQIQLMRRCLAIIQPSLFEGWSTVIEDARTLGKPMLVSDFPVHLEQNPPHTYFFERHNPEQLASLISQALLNLKPGPDMEAENRAREKNHDATLNYGRRFLEIVRNYT